MAKNRRVKCQDYRVSLIFLATFFRASTVVVEGPCFRDGEGSLVRLQLVSVQVLDPGRLQAGLCVLTGESAPSSFAEVWLHMGNYPQHRHALPCCEQAKFDSSKSRNRASMTKAMKNIYNGKVCVRVSVHVCVRAYVCICVRVLVGVYVCVCVFLVFLEVPLNQAPKWVCSLTRQKKPLGYSGVCGDRQKDLGFYSRGNLGTAPPPPHPPTIRFMSPG